MMMKIKTFGHTFFGHTRFGRTLFALGLTALLSGQLLYAKVSADEKANSQENYTKVKAKNSILQALFEARYDYTQFAETKEGADYSLTTLIPIEVETDEFGLHIKNIETGTLSFKGNDINFEGLASLTLDIIEDGEFSGSVDLIPAHDYKATLTPKNKRFIATHTLKDIDTNITPLDEEGEVDTYNEDLIANAKVTHFETKDETIFTDNEYNQLKTKTSHWQGTGLSFTLREDEENDPALKLTVDKIEHSNQLDEEKVTLELAQAFEGFTFMFKDDSPYSSVENLKINFPKANYQLKLAKDQDPKTKAQAAFSSKLDDIIVGIDERESSFGSLEINQTGNGYQIDSMSEFLGKIGQVFRIGMALEGADDEKKEELNAEYAAIVQSLMQENSTAYFEIISRLVTDDTFHLEANYALNKKYFEAIGGLSDPEDFDLEALLEGIDEFKLSLTIPQNYLVEQAVSGQALYDQNFVEANREQAKQSIKDTIEMGYMFLSMSMPDDYKLYDETSKTFKAVILYQNGNLTLNGVPLDLNEFAQMMF